MLNLELLDASWAQLVAACALLVPTWSVLGASWAELGGLGYLLDATWMCAVGTGCTVRAELGSKMVRGALTCSLHSQYDLQLARQLPFQSTPDLQKEW